ncbi:hypothetical protein [Pleionea sp. CnH1-48]|uniref:hypothetical protein n=1 Tax=Pleionea sp. CnH1-48 TaxID=2954494 RepID=UPI002097532E|nr:hypothetical protein [Pleionea sp. CnH1-48]MCO7224127.1 hypothetical protein [Pleionea sp. CnH1-48]
MKHLIGGFLGGLSGTLLYEVVMNSDEGVDFYRAVFVGVFVGVALVIAAKFDKKKSQN